MPVSKKPVPFPVAPRGGKGVGGTSTPLDYLSICVSLFSMSVLLPPAKKSGFSTTLASPSPHLPTPASET